MELPKHMPALDGLRGMAIILVIMSHVALGRDGAMSLYRNVEGWAATFTIPSWVETIASSGGLGVQLFFVVSAFTLTLRAARSRTDGLGSYALRRVARVGPGYWLAGIGYTLLSGLAPRLWAPHGVGASDLAIAAVFGSAWQGAASLVVVPGGWSVSCEVAFYIALPLLLRVIDGRIWRALALTAVAIVLASVQYSLSLPKLGPFSAFINPIGQAPVFLFGITAAMLALRFSFPRIPGASLLLVLIAVIGLPFSPSHHKLYLQFTFVVTLLVLLNAVYPSSVLASRVMRKIGEVSYSMYLIHFVVLLPSLIFAEWLFPADDLRTMLTHLSATILLTFVLACLTYAFIEQPAIRWAASQTRRLATPATAPLTSS